MLQRPSFVSFNDRRLKEIEPSLVAHLDFDLAVPLLEEGNVLTVDEAAHVLRRARALSKEHAVHELVRILAASPFRSLRCALERCAGTHGHRELLKELDRLVTADMESGMSETEPKTEGHQQSGDDLGQVCATRARCINGDGTDAAFYFCLFVTHYQGFYHLWLGNWAASV